MLDLTYRLNAGVVQYSVGSVRSAGEPWVSFRLWTQKVNCLTKEKTSFSHILTNWQKW
jgi:hypothetical protein